MGTAFGKFTDDFIVWKNEQVLRNNSNITYYHAYAPQIQARATATDIPQLAEQIAVTAHKLPGPIALLNAVQWRIFGEPPITGEYTAFSPDGGIERGRLLSGSEFSELERLVGERLVTLKATKELVGSGHYVGPIKPRPDPPPRF